MPELTYADVEASLGAEIIVASHGGHQLVAAASPDEAPTFILQHAGRVLADSSDAGSLERLVGIYNAVAAVGRAPVTVAAVEQAVLREVQIAYRGARRERDPVRLTALLDHRAAPTYEVTVGGQAVYAGSEPDVAIEAWNLGAAPQAGPAPR